jgi:hypothetical protein
MLYASEVLTLVTNLSFVENKMQGVSSKSNPRYTGERLQVQGSRLKNSKIETCRSKLAGRRLDITYRSLIQAVNLASRKLLVETHP